MNTAREKLKSDGVPTPLYSGCGTHSTFRTNNYRNITTSPLSSLDFETTINKTQNTTHLFHSSFNPQLKATAKYS
ncbi:hypothetical protein BJ917_5823 [Pseudomonas sp. WPR_5_2]|nr:hypothetical protein BJ917_5823 [Pseudomonas sp. WPR_5_2]